MRKWRHIDTIYFSSNLFQVMADRLIEEKFVTEYDENGWVYVMVDDCWSEIKRDETANSGPTTLDLKAGWKTWPTT